jgi:hypothetical protein
MEPLDPAAGEHLFEELVERLVLPELERRIAAGQLPGDTLVYRFQSLLHDDQPAEVRLNDEVRGTVTVEKAPGRVLKAGDTVFADDILGIAGFEPDGEDIGVAHLTGLMHHGGWGLAFEFGRGHPSRHDFLERGREFLETARHAADSGRLGAFVDTSLSACELLAKAELLASQPTVELVLNRASHKAVSRAYNAWSALGNTERRFAQLLDRLHELRSAGRYLDRELTIDSWTVAAILSTLDDMHEHVRASVSGQTADAPEEAAQTFIARRSLQAGELVISDDVTIFPIRTPN